MPVETRQTRKNKRSGQTSSSPSSSACIQNDDSIICPSTDESFVSYANRKTQRVGRDDTYIIDNGIEYDGTNPIMTDLFDDAHLSEKVHTLTGVENVRRSYIYIISKKIDKRTFIKIGISRISNTSASTRLGFLHTALIPGLENIGFKLHYLFFYSRESKEKGSTFAENIEKDLHKTLRNDARFKETVIQFPSGNSSEWYLPLENNYEKFIRFVLMFISAQKPFPEEGYHFYIKYQKQRRDDITRFMKEPSAEAIQKLRTDYQKLKGEILAKHKLTKREQDLKKGSKTYFKSVLLKTRDNTPPLGNQINIKSIYYHNKADDAIRIRDEYYVEVENASHSNHQPNIQIDFTENENGATQTKYFTHISHVLNKMKTEGTLDLYGLGSNYNHYHDGPIQKAKRILDSIDIKSQVKFKPRDLKWCIGRIVRDKHEDLYIATELKLDARKNNKVKHVVFQKVDEDHNVIEPVVEQKTNNLIALQLLVDFHDDIVSDFSIDDEYQQEGANILSNTKYSIYDFIEFKSRYFVDESTGRKLASKFVGVIVQVYFDYDGDKEYVPFYDILFEEELWKLEAANVDENSSKITSTEKKKRFINKAKYKRHKLAKVIKELGLEVRVAPPNKTRKVVATNESGPATRSQTRKNRLRSSSN